MNEDDKSSDPRPPNAPTAHFDPSGAPTFIQTVTLNTDRVDVHQASLGALERMAQHSPETAQQLIEGSKFVVKQQTKRFMTGAIVAGIVACALVGFSAYVIVNAGFWAGIALFLAIVAASALLVAALTGKVQKIDWVVGLIPGGGGAKALPPETPNSSAPES